MVRMAPLYASFIAALLLALPGLAEDLQRLRSKLQRETDPIDRAKITAKLGDELLKQMGRRYHDRAYAEGEALLTEYLEAVRSATRGLHESGRDARRKPAGFKQLEVHLRKSQRKLEEIGKQLPPEKREPLQEAQTVVETLRSELLQALMGGNRQPKSDI